jgi:uncharacterized protein YbgA (DUF1722 family)/uncharacterized protein YbbK (DUF523 family)
MKLIKSVTLSSNEITQPKKDSAGETPLIHVGLSACLAGHEVRYNGGHSQSRFCLDTLSQYFSFKTFCPEVAAGFSVPRPTMRLVGDPANPRLTYSDNDDANLTQQLNDAIHPQLAKLDHLDGYVLMKNSPSCGYERVKVYQANGHPHTTRRQGIFTEQLQKKYPLLPIEEDGRLNDPRLRENFILRVYAHYNFRHEVQANLSLHSLIKFHSRYKYSLMAHHQVLYKKLGKMLSNIGDNSIEDVSNSYFKLFMQALAKPASVKNQTNTLLHILGYLKKSVSSESRIKIANIIHKYRQRKLPLITPITLLSHYIEQHGSLYIREQRYFNPYPEALGLQNRI